MIIPLGCHDEVGHPLLLMLVDDICWILHLFLALILGSPPTLGKPVCGIPVTSFSAQYSIHGERQISM